MRYGLPDGNPEDLRKAVTEDPEALERRAEEQGVSVEQAARMEALQRENQALRRMRREQEQRQAQEEQRRQQEQAEADFRLLQRLDPSIQTMDDLFRMPEFPMFRARVERGMSFTQAYKDLHYEDAVRRAREEGERRGRQQERNAAASKDHLSPHGKAGAEVLREVPPEVMELYRELDPKGSAEAIKRHYNRYLTGLSG